MAVIMQITNEQLTSGALTIQTETADLNKRKLFLLDLYQSHLGSQMREDPCSLIVGNVEIGDHSTVTELTGLGYDALNLSFQTTNFPTQWTWWKAAMPFVISQTEIEQNGNGIYKIADRRVANVLNAFPRLLEKQLVQGSVSGFSALSSLNGVDLAAGFMEGSAPAVQTHSIGGIARTTTATLPGWNHLYGNVLSSYASNGQAVGRDIKATMMHREYPADFVLASTSFAANHLRSLSGHEIFVDAEQKGKPRTEYFGLPMSTSEYMPNAGATTATAGSEISAYGISASGIPLKQLGDNNMRMHKWEDGNTWHDLDGTLVKIGVVTCMMQLTGFNFGGSFLIQGGDRY